MINFDPTLFSQIGTYPITIEVKDSYGHSLYSFNVNVLNSPPAFSGVITSPAPLHVGGTATVTLPSYSDPDGHALTLSLYETGQAALPTFITFTAPNLLVAPTVQSQVGSYSVTAEVCDSQPLCASLSFSVSVVNDAPTFVAGLLDQTVSAGKSVSYKFPAIYDFEGDVVAVSITE